MRVHLRQCFAGERWKIEKAGPFRLGERKTGVSRAPKPMLLVRSNN
jgi:hypothetical protein